MFLKYNQFSIGMFVIVFLMCLLPGSEMPQLGLEHMDKAVHGVLFALLTYCMIIGFLKQYQFYNLALNAVKISIITGMVYGVLIEVFQGLYLEDRAFEWYDIVSDWAGVGVGFCAFLIVKGKESFV